MEKIYCKNCYKQIIDLEELLVVDNESFHEKCFNPNKEEKISHPSYYGGKDNPYEAIKIIRHYKLGFCLGNTLKYIIRAGKKDPEKYIEDLEKAKQYLEFKIEELKQEQEINL